MTMMVMVVKILLIVKIKIVNDEKNNYTFDFFDCSGFFCSDYYRP